jgi:serine protease Do
MAQGALVATVQPDSPAAKAGLQPGDVIEQVDGKTVANPRDLAVAVAAVKPGDQVPLSIVRNGETQTVTATVTTMPNQNVASNGSGQDDSGQGTPRVGLALAPISPDMREQLGLPEHAHGAVVQQVTPGSPADGAGIQQGDVVVGVGNKPVGSPQAAIEAIQTATKGGHDVALRILRNGHAAFVALDMHHVQQAPQGSNDDSDQG